jgi:sulfide:quinone oxidoreductase
MKEHYNTLIIGGGTGGIMMGSQLIRKGFESDIAIIDPAEYHYYQPAWTLVGAGTYNYQDTKRKMSGLIPKGADWIQQSVAKIIPTENKVVLDNDQSVTYEYLIVSPGLKYDFSLVPGLKEVMDDPNSGAGSVYLDPEKVWQNIKDFKGGVALFTQPTTPLKCGGAPQKVMYLAEAAFKKQGKREKAKIIFATNGSVIFGIKPVKETLMKVVDRKNLNLKFGHRLTEIDPKEKIAWYKLGDTKGEYNDIGVEMLEKDGMIGIKYDFLHTAIPSVAPKFIVDSGLANDAGWMDVDHYSLQHKEHKNIFGIGDVAALPTGKTGAAIRKQVPVVIDNIESLKKGKEDFDKKYNGYSSCPIVTDYGKMVLAEFDYEGNFTPDPKLKWMLINDSSKEHWRLWMLKKYGLPYLYWNKMMRGKDT